MNEFAPVPHDDELNPWPMPLLDEIAPNLGVGDVEDLLLQGATVAVLIQYRPDLAKSIRAIAEAMAIDALTGEES